jgi:Sensors of blue-light using FAD
MPARLHRVVYVSRWANGLGEDIRAALRRIVTASIAKNRLCDVTGLLLAHEGWFVQALEGPELAVQALTMKIAHDPRHRDVRVVLSAPDEARMFGDWSMAASKLGPECEPLLIEIGQVARFDGHALDADTALRLLMLAGERGRESESAGSTRSAA